ncbi:hypothetical protein BB560_006877 [Smittium megazygosporum]|uniref:ZW10 C-terminal helical domain-containing protein n=1 Tax=Smittium megazygosporum TaxID=133381 RepID=A0A2T9Y0M9_9FUNG|nr:hypothetical protein BB560_006877 [Smittium megazygosporum]
MNQWEELKSQAISMEKTLLECNAIVPENKPFTTYASNAIKNYSQLYIDNVLEKVRKEVLRTDLKESVSSDIEANLLNSINIQKYVPAKSLFPRLVLSEAAAKIVEYLYDLMHLIANIEGSEHKNMFSKSISTSVGVYCSLRYKTLLPMIKKAGSLAVTYYNDTLFLAYHTENIIIAIKAYAESNQDAINEANIQEIEWFNTQLSYSAQNGFSDLDSITPHVYCMVIGSAINDLYQEVYSEVVAIKFISARDSNVLYQTLKDLMSLEKLLTSENSKMGWESPLGSEAIEKYIPIRFSFDQLKDIMTLSMSEIVGRHKIGYLDCIDLEDLLRLVYALFEDSEIRKSTIEKIKG